MPGPILRPSRPFGASTPSAAPASPVRPSRPFGQVAEAAAPIVRPSRPFGAPVAAGLTTVEEGQRRGEVSVMPQASPSPTPRVSPSPAPSVAPTPNPGRPFVGPIERPKHLLEMMQDQAKTPSGEVYRQALERKKAEPWMTHLDWNAGLAHNLAAPALYALKTVGEPFMAVPRLLRGASIPGTSVTMDNALKLAGDLYKAAPPSAMTPYANAPPDFRQRVLGLPPAPPSNIPPEFLDGRSYQDRYTGTYPGFMPADLAALAPSLASKFATGGAAVFGDRARGIAEQAGQREREIGQQAEAALWSDPRDSETLLQTGLRSLPGVGAIFDPQTQTIGQKLNEEAGAEAPGLLLDLGAGFMTPWAAANKVLGTAGQLARRGGSLVESVAQGEGTLARLARPLTTDLRNFDPSPMDFDLSEAMAAGAREAEAIPARQMERSIREAAQARGEVPRPTRPFSPAPEPQLGPFRVTPPEAPPPPRAPQVAPEPVRLEPVGELAAKPLEVAKPARAFAPARPEPAVAQAPAETPNTRGQGTQFHGSSRPVAISEGHYENRNIYGQGFYTTDALDVAKSYTSKGAKRSPGEASPSLYEVRERQPVRFFDLEQTLGENPEVARKFRRILEQDGQDEALVYLDGENPTFADLLNEMRRNPDVPRDQVQEAFDAMQHSLRAEGYGGWQHVGGKLTGKVEPHQVKIYFDPHQQLDLVPHGEARPVAPELARPATPSPAEIGRRGEAYYTPDRRMFATAEEAQAHLDRQQASPAFNPEKALDDWERAAGDLQAGMQAEALRVARANSSDPRFMELTRAWKQDVPAFAERATPAKLEQFSDRVAELAPSMGEQAAARLALHEMFQVENPGVQYAGTSGQQFNTQAQVGPSRMTPPPPAPPVAPAPAPAPGIPPPQGPAAPPAPAPAGPTPNPPRTAGTVTKSLNQGEINRRIRGVVSAISRGEYSKPSLLRRAQQALSPESGPRFSYGASKLPKGTPGAYHGSHGLGPQVGAGRDLIEVRTAGSKSGETLYHEVGHAVANHTPLIANAPAGAMADLDRLGDPSLARPSGQGVTTSWKPGNSQAYKNGEGFAEFVRLWMQFPQEAQRMAPEMFKHWESWLDQADHVGREMRVRQAEVQAKANATFEAEQKAQIMRESQLRKLEAKSAKDGFVQKYFDRYHSVRQMVANATKAGMEVLPTLNPYKKLTTMRARAMAGVNREMDTLQGILAPVLNGPAPREALDRLERYLLALHFNDMQTPHPEAPQGLPTGWSPGAIQEGLALGQQFPELRGVARKIHAFQDAQLDMSVRMKLIGQAQADAMRARWPNYIPTQRHYELGAGEMASDAGLDGGSFGATTAQASDPFKRLHGSDRPVLEPLVSIIENTANIQLQIHKNDALLDLARLYDEHGNRLGHGMNEEKALPDNFTDFAGQNIIRVFDGDKSRHFKLSPSLYRSLNEDSLTLDWLTRFNQAWGNFLRPGATKFNPGFALANTIRDSLALPFVTRVGGTTNLPFFPFIEGLVTQVDSALGGKGRQTIDDFVNAGGHQDFSAGVADRASAHTLQQGFMPKTTAQNAGGRVLGGTIGAALGGGLAGIPGAMLGGTIGTAAGLDNLKKWLASVTNASEQSTRLGHFQAARRYFRAKNPAWSAEDVDFAAAFEARDTLDFSRRGTSHTMRHGRANIPFLGATVEGGRRSAEALLENPLRVVLAGLALQAAPSALNLWLNRDDPDYWQIPQERRDKFFFIRNPYWDGKKAENKFIPIPQVQGIFANFKRLPEWAVQASLPGGQHGRERVREMASTLFQDVLPANIDPAQWVKSKESGVLPYGLDVSRAAANLAGLAGPAVGTFAELGANRDFFRQKDIETGAAARAQASPTLRTKANTSVLAQVIARALPMQTSPIHIDHLINRLAAGTGQMLINNVADPLLSAGSKKVAEATGDPSWAIEENELRSAGTPGEKGLDLMRLRYKPHEYDSEGLFETELERLQQAKAEAAHRVPKNEGGQPRLDHPAYRKAFSIEMEQRLAAMEQVDKLLQPVRKMLFEEKDPDRRNLLTKVIREQTSNFTPPVGGKF